MKRLARTRVKICGITNVEDAQACVVAGADAIGFVFYENSPRCVSIEQAREIANRVAPFINCVGLFVDAEQHYIHSVLKRVAIDTIQFHGREPEQSCTLYGKPYIKAVRMEESTDPVQQQQEYSAAQALLLDTFVSGVPGGTGTGFDWDRIPADLNKPVILAGGLNEKNVRAAITRVRPYAVDVSGGVEIKPGKKDPDKIKNFIREAMNA